MKQGQTQKVIVGGMTGVDTGAAITFGGPQVVVIAGPCSIESEAHLRQTAKAVKSRGASVLRGGVFKMRTQPNSFQGVGLPALDYIPKVLEENQMPVACEVTDPRQLEAMLPVVDLIQVGSRNMYNYELLKELALVNRPVLLKRAFAATLDEWLKASEYITRSNPNVILCERGIRTFETATRNTLDLNAVAWLKAHSNLPVVVDPSHGTGRRELVLPMALAGIAAGADGVICEVHPVPDQALSDAFQAIDFETFEALVSGVDRVAQAVGRTLFQSTSAELKQRAEGSQSRSLKGAV